MRSRTAWVSNVGLLLLGACQPGAPDPEPGDPGLEVPGQPLEQLGFCRNGAPRPPREFSGSNLRDVGACGDVVIAGNDQITLIPVDAEHETLAIPVNSFADLSPRGRLLVLYDRTNDALILRDLDTDTQQQWPMSDGRYDFVLSKQAPGARLWICESWRLDVVVDGERVELADGVNCPSVAASPMHSTLAFADSDGRITWADTDAMTVAPTSLTGFEYGLTAAAGVRRDFLTMTPSGPYLRYAVATLEVDGDGELIPFTDESVLFDLAEDQVVLEASWFEIGQASLFEAPLFVTVAGELFAVQAGEATSLGTGVHQLAGGIDSALVLTNAGAVLRYGGEGFDVVETEVPASLENTYLHTSPAGHAGYASGLTDICATPECQQHLFSLRSFGPEGSGEPVLSRSIWNAIDVGDDGTIVADALVVEGTVGDWSEFPFPQLLVFAPDGTIAAEWEHHPDMSDVGHARLADGRIAVGYRDVGEDDVLVIVDPATAEIVEAEVYPDGPGSMGDIHEFWGDASGQVVVLHIDTRFRITSPQ